MHANEKPQLFHISMGMEQEYWPVLALKGLDIGDDKTLSNAKSLVKLD